MPKTINRDLLAGFAGEVKSYLPQIRESFRTLTADPARTEALEEAHRLTHSIKGAASMLGLSALSHMAFLAEEVIEEVASRQLDWNPNTTAAVERVLALCETYLDQLASGALRERPILGEAVIRLRRLRGLAESGDQGEIDLLLGTGGDPIVEDAVPSPASVGAAEKRIETARRPVSAAQIQQEYQNIPLELLDTFRGEAEEIMHAVGGLLRRLESGGADKQALLDIRRHVHTLKGAAGSVGLRAPSSLAHRMEDLLDEVNQGGIPYSSDVHTLLVATCDCLADMTEAQNLEEVGSRTEALYARYSSLLEPAGGSPGAANGGAAGSPIERGPIPIELVEAFRAEAEEHLLRVGEGLRELEKNPANKPLVQEIRRTIHTLKGAANMIGMRQMSGLAHETEDVLDLIYEDAVPLSLENISLLFSITDTLSDLAAGKQPEALPQRLQLLSKLSSAATRSRTSAPLEPLASEKAIDVPQAPEQMGVAGGDHRSTQFVRVPIERLDELVRLVSELLVSRSTFEQYLSTYSREVDELSLSIGRLKRVSSRIDTDFQTSALRGGFGQLSIRGVVNPGALDETRPDFDALEMDRYTDFHLISRDLTETTGDLASAGAELAHRIADFDSYLNRLGRLTSEVQDKLMRMRMVPLLTLTTRLHRTVRVTAERRQKAVELRIEGERVELDKTVLEDIAAPLEHLLRNAVDHGIESAATRRALGKPPRGEIRLRAFHEGTQVVVQVTDDGGGMEPEALREAAVRSGLYSEAEAAQLALSDLHNLIFHPGFSTARAVSETSGRGVGMDIVKSTINRMKGTVAVDTEPGRGTTITLRLPMTLAIMRVLLVQTNGETMAVPLSTVSQILRIEPQQIEYVGQQMVIRVEEKVIPAIRLGGAPSAAALRSQPAPYAGAHTKHR